MQKLAGVWIHLRRDSVFGRSIKFLPCSSLFGFSKLAWHHLPDSFLNGHTSPPISVLETFA